jgi:hypothetical protein
VLWSRVLGFLDWTPEQFLAFQDRLMARQLATVRRGRLGSQLIPSPLIHTARELRDAVPLTTYKDYAATLGERDETALPTAPHSWLLTTGRDDGGAKWIPLSREAHAQLGWSVLGLFIAATAPDHGVIELPAFLRLLNMTAPSPYMSGSAVAAFAESGLWQTLLYPPGDPDTDRQPFEVRMASAFEHAARDGVDIAVSYSSVLAGIGRTFGSRFGSELGSSAVLPRDVWKLRGIVAGGMDSMLFRAQIREQWGCDPLELFASTEGLFLGMQTWERDAISLIPYFNYFEFIPQGELEEEANSEGHQPDTRFLDELDGGEVYELVVTNLLGGAFVRYRTGELLRSLGESSVSTRLPQFRYVGQRSELLEIAGFARLSEKVIDQAVAAAGVRCEGWIASKEAHGGSPVVHLMIEPLQDVALPLDAVAAIDTALGRLDDDWRDMRAILKLQAIRISRLAPGTLHRYAESSTHKLASRLNVPQHVLAVLSAISDGLDAE